MGLPGAVSPVVDELCRACGDEAVRPAGTGDVVGGVPATYVAEPATTEAAAAVLRIAAEHGLATVVRGAGTKLDWGGPPERADLLLDTTRMAAVEEHAAGDLVVRVQPGLRLADLNRRLADAGQRLAVDEVVPGTTVGGLVATGVTGPLRFGFGGVRDLLIGVTVVRADGSVTRSGGKVVKNVAGYDLGKLYTGSYGTLGVLTEAIFRLHPLPGTAAYVSASVAADGLAAALAAITGSQLAPSAVEVDRADPAGPATVVVLLEGVADGVPARAEHAARALGGGTVSPEPPPWWARLPATAGDTLLKLAVPLSGVAPLLRRVAEVASAAGLPVAVRGSAGTGLLYASVPAAAPAAEVARFVGELRSTLDGLDGAATVLDAPTAVRSTVDMWGPTRGLQLMRRVKQEFDPGRRLAPGRFVGGI